MAENAKRWFAKPPTGYSRPCETALSDFSVFGNMMHKTPEAIRLFKSLSRLTGEDLIIRLTHMHIIQTWLAENGPTFFVDPDILQACEKTDVLGCIQGSDLKVVYPSGYFCLPSGMGHKSPFSDDSVHHIWFKFIEKGDPITIYLNGGKGPPRHSDETPLIADSRKLMLISYWDKAHDSQSYNLPLDIPGKTLAESIKHYSEIITVDASRPLEQAQTEAETVDFGLRAGALVCNLCLIMQSYPQYLAKLGKEASFRQNFANQTPPQSMLIRRSKERDLQQIVRPHDSHEGDPTGRAVSTHWRRGHWRRQPHGVRWEVENPDAKIIVLDDERHAHMQWLEPMLIMSPEVNQPATSPAPIA